MKRPAGVRQAWGGWEGRRALQQGTKVKGARLLLWGCQALSVEHFHSRSLTTKSLMQSSMWYIDFLCNFQLTFEYMISQGHNKRSLTSFNSPLFLNKLPLKHLLSTVSFWLDWFFKKNTILSNSKYDFLAWTFISTSNLPLCFLSFVIIHWRIICVLRWWNQTHPYFPSHQNFYRVHLINFFAREIQCSTIFYYS